MKVYHHDTITPEERDHLLRRSTAAIFDPALLDGVRAIVDNVRTRGDAALVDALARFDGCVLTPSELRVGDEEFAAAEEQTSAAVRRGIDAAIANVRRYNERLMQHGSSWLESLGPGMIVGEKVTPVASAGLYVPCGKGSFPSVMIHLGTPAVVAGVPRLAVVVPPMRGQGTTVDPAVLVAAAHLGIREVYRSAGVAGIAALAYGTATIPRVWRINGPGNPYIQAAQVVVQLAGVRTDMVFGPSETVVLADESADPRLIAADLLTEAEHGSDSAALLVTDSAGLLAAVDRELEALRRQLPEPQRSHVAASTTTNGGALLVRDIEEGIQFVDDYAPEHLQIATRDPLFVAGRIHNAAEILIGQNTPNVVANYTLGTPNTLPTGGFAKVTSAVTAFSFLKRSSLAYLQHQALASLAPDVLALADHEGFPGHALALRVRGFGS
ncbi:MAG: histidinol dehydrogenase [Chloroflexota bacterium]